MRLRRSFAAVMCSCARRFGSLALLFLAAAHLSACSKSVEWDEEVPLNTGQTLVVHRKATYSLQGDAGNPLAFAYRPERNEALEFDWDGRHFRYEGDALPLVLAISPQRVPVLVAPAANNSWWAAHGYACTLPFYVQLTPQADGRTWSWPPHIESWLYGLPKNLMLSRELRDRKAGRVTAAEARQIDQPALAGRRSLQEIDVAYPGDPCRNTRRK
jgi:hypothetical protein